jgi:Anti-sigma factor NepR
LSSGIRITAVEKQKRRGCCNFMAKLNKEAHGARPVRGKASAADMLGPNSEIARLLGDHYKSLLSDEVPDRFMRLLDRLEESELTNKAETAKTKAEG